MNPTSDLVLEVKQVSAGYLSGGLTKRGGKYKRVLHDVDFSVRHGEILSRKRDR